MIAMLFRNIPSKMNVLSPKMVVFIITFGVRKALWITFMEIMHEMASRILFILSELTVSIKKVNENMAGIMKKSGRV
jgi:hypothetical protein